MLVDSHCHLDFDAFDEDRADAIKRAKDAESGQWLPSALGSPVQGILSIADSDPNIWCSVGIHPHQVEEEPRVTIEDLVSRAKNPKGRDRRNGPRLLL